MKKTILAQLRFLARYLASPRRLRRLLNTQSALIVIVSSVFLFTLAWTSPRAFDREMPSAHGYQATPTGESVVAAAISQQTTEEVEETLSPLNTLEVTPSPGPTRTRTPFPPEFYTNAEQSVGISLAGAALVLIVVVGVLTLMPRSERK